MKQMHESFDHWGVMLDGELQTEDGVPRLFKNKRAALSAALNLRRYGIDDAMPVRLRVRIEAAAK